MKNAQYFLVPLLLLAVLWYVWPSSCDCWPWSDRLEGTNRFTSAFNGAAFLDRETGLVWETGQDALAREWVIAREVCMNRNIGGRKGWRLPAFNELTSLIDPAQTNPALPVGHPFQGILNSGYWSASSSALAASPGTHAVFVDFGLGDVSMVNKSTLASVKCVRGRMAGPTVY
jgi:hypothetical protein